jgi:hypothetical protein
VPKRDAAWFRREAAKERLAAQQAISRAELWERTADEIERLHGRVHSDTRKGRMEQPQAQAAKRRRGRELKSDGPVARAAKASGRSMHEIAQAMGLPYTTVKSWDARGSVPSRHRQALAEAAPARAAK